MSLLGKEARAENQINSWVWPPYVDLDDTRGNNRSRTSVVKNIAEQLKTQERDYRPLYFGKRSAHDPKNLIKPRFEGEKKRPHLLEEAKRLLLNNFFNVSVLPLWMHSGKKENGENDGVEKPSTLRRRRSQAREAIFIVLPWIIHTLNLWNHQCGHHTKPYIHEKAGLDSEFVNYDYNFLEEKTGLSRIRIKRHMITLQKHGFCQVTPIFDTYIDDTGRERIKTDKTIIRVSRKIFDLLGLAELYDNTCKEISDKYREAQRKEQARRDRLNGYAPAKPFGQVPKNFSKSGDAVRQILSAIGGSGRPARPYQSRRPVDYYDNSADYSPYRDERIKALARQIMKEEFTKKQRKEMSYKERYRQSFLLACLRSGIDPPRER